MHKNVQIFPTFYLWFLDKKVLKVSYHYHNEAFWAIFIIFLVWWKSIHFWWQRVQKYKQIRRYCIVSYNFIYDRGFPRHDGPFCAIFMSFFSVGPIFDHVTTNNRYKNSPEVFFIFFPRPTPRGFRTNLVKNVE